MVFDVSVTNQAQAEGRVRSATLQPFTATSATATSVTATSVTTQHVVTNETERAVSQAEWSWQFRGQR